MADLYAGADPRLLPAYTAADAGRCLKIPHSTVRSWVKGQYYTTNAGRRFFKPIIDLPDAEPTSLCSIDQAFPPALLKPHGG